MPNTRVFLFCNAAEAHYSTSCSVMYGNMWHGDNTSLCTMQTGHANTVCTVCCVSGKSSDKYLKFTQMCVWEATALRRHSSGWLLRRPNIWVSQKRKEGAAWQDWTRRLSSNRAPWMGEIRMPVFCSAFHQLTFICFIYIFKDWKRFFNLFKSLLYSKNTEYVKMRWLRVLNHWQSPWFYLYQSALCWFKYYCPNVLINWWCSTYT